MNKACYTSKDGEIMVMAASFDEAVNRVRVVRRLLAERYAIKANNWLVDKPRHLERNLKAIAKATGFALEDLPKDYI